MSLESCHQPTYFMHVLIFINEDMNFLFLFLKLNFLFYDFYYSPSHYSHAENISQCCVIGTRNTNLDRRVFALQGL